MNRIGRRQFLHTAGVATVAAGGVTAAQAINAAIVLDPADPAANAASVRWAAEELRQALIANGGRSVIVDRVAQADRNGLVIVGAGKPSGKAESLSLSRSKAGGRDVLLAQGADARGLVYALLELADRVQHSSDLHRPVAEAPANSIRSVTRLFCSDVHDKAWYNDREMWPKYLTMLANQRFNRFNLSFGIGYDFIREVTDAYFLFTYPFLLSVPGYNVRVPQLPDAERDSNLAMLRFISEQTVARGMQFQLGLWMHGYEWINSPAANYTVAGLTKQNHGAYCRDAVRTLLQALPAVSGVTFRVHGESGVEEGSYEFWKTVFEGVKTCGRKVEIDMHSKGMDQAMLDLGVATGLPLKISPKFWAEHMGLPYHQADIRPVEYPSPDREAGALMRFSAGSRRFTRYGYADLMREDRRWGILHRIWPGTQRLLMWGDPVMAASYSRAFTFCGSDGVEIMEPLAFKGRRGSGLPGNRGAYADSTLAPRWDWEKHAYGHRVWGRLLFNPDTEPDVWQRYLRSQFGRSAAPAAEAALGNASRILPTITTAHGASAANNTYWPEVYTNQPWLAEVTPNPYTDSPAPRTFGAVSPFDPQLFYGLNDFADDLVKGKRSGKYSPLEVAQWLEDYSAAALQRLTEFETKADMKLPESRRLAHDVAIQAGLGRFFSAKFRGAMLFRVFEQTGSRAALENALTKYRSARAAWAELANRAKPVYVADITVGERPFLRGHWLDRLPAIDADIAAVEKKLASAKDGAPPSAVIAELLGRPRRVVATVRHESPQRFKPGQPLVIEMSLAKKAAAVRLYYRHVTQAERFQSVEMEQRDNRYRASISASYTDSPYPLQYYFEIEHGPEEVTLYPAFGENITGQPYYVIRRS